MFATLHQHNKLTTRISSTETFVLQTSAVFAVCHSSNDRRQTCTNCSFTDRHPNIVQLKTTAIQYRFFPTMTDWSVAKQLAESGRHNGNITTTDDRRRDFARWVAMTIETKSSMKEKINMLCSRHAASSCSCGVRTPDLRL